LFFLFFFKVGAGWGSFSLSLSACLPACLPACLAQVVVAIMGFYATLITVGKLSSGGGKKAAAAPVAAAAAGAAFAASGYKSGVEPGAGGVPSFTDAAFDVSRTPLPGLSVLGLRFLGFTVSRARPHDLRATEKRCVPSPSPANTSLYSVFELYAVVV
jgi:hypothetical protein